MKSVTKTIIKRVMILTTLAAGVMLSACNNDNDNSSGTSNDPILKESVRITNQPISNFENAEPTAITVAERGIDDTAEPITLQF